MKEVSAYHVAVNDLVAELKRITKGIEGGRRREKRGVSDLHTPTLVREYSKHQTYK